MERWFGKTAIVTGASAGIGAAIAEALVKVGMNVVGLARREDIITANAKKLTNFSGKLYAYKCDMQCEEDILEAFDWTTKHVGIVHVLVNNAGVLLPTNLIAGQTKLWKAMLDTNFLGLCIAQREAVKLMMSHNIAGHIININSIAGQEHLAHPILSVYGGTKHAVTNICHMLRHELNANKSPIKTTSISPGAVATKMTLNMDGVPKNFIPAMAQMSFMKCKDVADAVIYALGTPPTVNINEITMRPVELKHNPIIKNINNKL